MGLEKTWRWFGENDTIKLSEIRQIGVEGIVTALHHTKPDVFAAVYPENTICDYLV